MDREQENLLLLATRTLKFASDHPYAATGIFGAAVGSVVTYKVLTLSSVRDTVNEVFTPKVYEFALTEEDLRRMLVDPTAKLRWDTPEMSVIVTSEQKERVKQLPDISNQERHV